MKSNLYVWFVAHKDTDELVNVFLDETEANEIAKGLEENYRVYKAKAKFIYE